MKHGSRQSQQARNAATGQGSEVAKSQYLTSNPGAKGKGPRLTPGETLALLATVQSVYDLAERLKQHGCDIYAGGPYETPEDRVAGCIVRNVMQTVVVGRGPDGRRPEAYAEAFERLCGRALPKPTSAKPHTQATARRSSQTEGMVAGESVIASQDGSGCVTREEPDTS